MMSVQNVTLTTYELYIVCTIYTVYLHYNISYRSYDHSCKIAAVSAGLKLPVFYSHFFNSNKCIIFIKGLLKIKTATTPMENYNISEIVTLFSNILYIQSARFLLLASER
jgi:hypothetical protein